MLKTAAEPQWPRSLGLGHIDRSSSALFERSVVTVTLFCARKGECLWGAEVDTPTQVTLTHPKSERLWGADDRPSGLGPPGSRKVNVYGHLTRNRNVLG